MRPQYLEAENLRRLPGVRHAFFTRAGGVSSGIYASLNTGLGSSDDVENVRENRRRAQEALGARWLRSPYQTHSSDCLIVREPEAGEPARRRREADAMVTAAPGLAVAVGTADCTPVLFADAGAGVVGAAHAGWRGALGGVLEATLEAMEAIGAGRGRIAAAIGPVIRRRSYEVGPEFRQRFLEEDAALEKFFTPARRAGRFLFDLPGFVRMRLEAAGVRDISDLGRCTFSEEDLFFSYRRSVHRGEPDYGRQLSAIMLSP